MEGVLCELQLYNFGETVSIVFWTDTWRPDSFYDKIAENRKRQMHTLCLLGQWHSYLDLLFPDNLHHSKSVNPVELITIPLVGMNPTAKCYETYSRL